MKKEITKPVKTIKESKHIEYFLNKQAMSMANDCLNKIHGVLIPFDSIDTVYGGLYTNEFIELVKSYYKKLYK